MNALISLPLAAAQNLETTVDDVTDWFNEPATRELIMERPLKILLILIVALVLDRVAAALIRRGARRRIANPGILREREPADTQQARTQENRRQQRLKTLANVSRSVAAIVVWTWAVLAILDQLGVNVAPLIASAGIVGVAIGFGAQSLVKDFFSGMFILLENQYGVGDTIEVGDVVGEVEEMTLRITTIRDMDGTLWYIRNGDIERVGNHSINFSVARLQVPVSVMADPDKVSSVIEDAAVTACQDPQIRDVVMGAPVMLGPSEFNPNYVSFRLTVRTMPGQQWAVARHINHRILKELHSADVVLAPMDSVLVEFAGSDTDEKADKKGEDNGHHPNTAAR